MKWQVGRLTPARGLTEVTRTSAAHESSLSNYCKQKSRIYPKVLEMGDPRRQVLQDFCFHYSFLFYSKEPIFGILTNLSSFQKNVLLTQRNEIMEVTETIKPYLNDFNERAKGLQYPIACVVFCALFLFFLNKNVCCISYKTMTMLGK